MQAEQAFSSLYRPNQNEQARQSFVGALKARLNGPVERQLAERYERALKPAYERRHGHPPRNREDGLALFVDDPLYRLWGAALLQSQTLMWESVQETCQRLLPELERRYLALNPETRLGRLELNPELDIPEPIASVEIHRQPGGYFGAPGQHELMTGLAYFGALELYRNAKGVSNNEGGASAGDAGMGRYMLDAVERRFPGLAPKAVLDLGCGPGTDAVAYRQRFPEAEIWGIDLSAPLLKFAHIWAEDGGHRINYRQADARRTGFAAGSFDLILSDILFHETWHDIVPDIMREARRLLRPAGVFLNVDVAYQTKRLNIPELATNHWQVANNGEPFWTGFADLDMGEQLALAGFAEEEIFADYDPLGQRHTHVFGARKLS